MRLGQTSFIYFLSRIAVSAIGFFATLYFARELGADVLGVYFLVLALVSWLKLAGEMGIGGALTKRLSEGTDRGAQLVAGGLVILALTVLLFVGIAAFEPYVRSYIGHQHGAVFVAVLVVIALLWGYATAALRGQHLVHLLAGISTFRTFARVCFQIGAVLGGLSLVGLIAGWAAGTATAAVIALVVSYRALVNSGDTLRRPTREHVDGLLSYAKYSWLGGVRGRAFNWVDVLVLGVFVQSGLIGVYSIAWNIASFLQIFGVSIRTSMFPEMSKVSAEGDHQQISTLVTDTLSFGGLIIIPGLVGGLLLGERLLQIYGPEFTTGTTVLGLLILAVLIYDYQLQFANTLNAIDRPDLSFRVNAVFIGANALLNLVLIYLYGWVGAAVATVLSAIIGLVGAFYYVRELVDFEIPLGEITKQWVAAGGMGAIVYGMLRIEDGYGLISYNAATVVIVAGVGAGVYFLLLLGLSTRFRDVIRDNAPIDIPLLTG